MREPTTIDVSPLHRHFSHLVANLGGAADAHTALAAKYVSFYLEKGNICLPLKKVAGINNFLASDAGESQRTPPLRQWVKSLKASALVGGGHDFTPLVLDEQHRLYLRRYWNYERSLAKDIQHRASNWAECDYGKLGTSLNRIFGKTANGVNWQKLAAFTSLAKNFSVISGGPGTGKTRTVVVILALLLEQAAGKNARIALCAPTGKAAARMTESILKTKAELGFSKEIDESLAVEATTIHRLLGFVPDTSVFRHNRETPLPHDVVIVDEASMVDLALMAKLFAAVKPSARLVLVGDKDQLASVESGAVLGDICNHGESLSISAELAQRYKSVTGDSLSVEALSDAAQLQSCIVELRQNFRFGSDSGIYRLSRTVNAGDGAAALDILKENTTADIAWSHVPKASELGQRLESAVREGYSHYLNAKTPEEAFHNFSKFRILCALKQGSFGVETINDLAKRILRDADLIGDGIRWYKGQPVMISRNDYNLKLFNGDIGIIWPASDTGELRAWFVAADGHVRQILPARLPEHETVFAMTIHKSQGSEFENILMVLPESDNRILTRELVYTGLTRARKRVEIWGTDEVFQNAVARRIERDSGLRDELWDSVANQDELSLNL